MTGVTSSVSVSPASSSRSAWSWVDSSGFSRCRTSGDSAQGPDLAAHAEPAAAVFAAGEDERPGGGERAAQPGQRCIASQIEDEMSNGGCHR